MVHVVPQHLPDPTTVVELPIPFFSSPPASAAARGDQAQASHAVRLARYGALLRYIGARASAWSAEVGMRRGGSSHVVDDVRPRPLCDEGDNLKGLVRIGRATVALAGLSNIGPVESRGF
ncbi:uncharacterized protein A4U43_C10F560 [Asparagus officinalis]|uniref:Uncharacterized protein n=1 Tax=Asparagus officinalis TaxID=4686 RepID=A0A5P1E2T5_ASPOF|nr:uncharacterized protein A4U43_C10F560 [Asparagus officinalis]